MFLVALIWGLAEATLFFVVPDVFLTYLGLFDLSLGLMGALWSLVGALIGGAVMYYLGVKDIEKMHRLLMRIPGISQPMIQHVKSSLESRGALALFLGPLKGVPYKNYAIYAYQKKISFSRFLLISIPARLIRFVLSVCVAYFIAYTWSPWIKVSALTLFWVLFYIWYFRKMRPCFQRSTV